MAKYLTTPLAFSVYLEGDNAVFGETAIHVIVNDEAGGAFITLKEFPSDPKPGEISMDFEQLEAIFEAARVLMKAQPK